MKHFLSLLTILSSGLAIADEAFSPDDFLASYCLECHDDLTEKGDRSFDSLTHDFTDLYTMEAWQEIVDQINLGEMPPSKADQPSDAETLAMVDWITKELAVAHAAFGDELTEPILRRLNQREYDFTVRTQLDLEQLLIDPTESFPPDAKVEHFETNGAALVMSDFLMKGYLESSAMLIDRATAKTAEAPEPQKWKFEAPFSRLPARPDGLDVEGKYQHIRKNSTYEDGFLWLSKFPEGVPHDGYYELSFKAAGINRHYPYDEDIVGVAKDERIRVAVVAGHPDYGDLKSPNGSDTLLFEVDLPDTKPKTFTRRVWLDKGYQPRFTYVNGPNRTKPLRGRTVLKHPEKFPSFLRFVEKGDNEFRGLPDRFLTNSDKSKHKKTSDTGRELDATRFYTNKNSSHGWSAWTREYKGPRVRLFQIELEGPYYDQWPPYSHEVLYGKMEPTLKNAPEILHRFASRMFRRPPTKEEVADLVSLATSHTAAGNSEAEGVRAGLQAVLCSPSFLYLNSVKTDPNLALAERLSLFLWNATPDYTTRRLVYEKTLTDTEVLRKEAERHIDDARIDRFVEDFTNTWLQLEKVGTQPPSHTTFPTYYTHALEGAMIAESRLFFKHLLSENLPITNFLDADFTFLNGDLARHYGIEHIHGSHHRRVKLYDRRRGGLLGQAAIHTASANGIDTSPVIRGIWILENVLGTPPSPPPPDIEPIEPDIRGVTTIREQLMKHREVQTCAECHRKIDPLGFAMENFDPIGGWRSKYEQTAKRPDVDATGAFPDGTGFSDVVDLREHLLNRKNQFAHALTEKLLTYGTGRLMTVTDRPHIDRIVKDLEEKGWGFQDLILLVVDSKIFRG